MILKTLRVGKNSTGVIVKSQIVTSRKGCYMAKSKENTEIVPVTIQANDIGNLICNDLLSSTNFQRSPQTY